MGLRNKGRHGEMINLGTKTQFTQGCVIKTKDSHVPMLY